MYLYHKSVKLSEQMRAKNWNSGAKRRTITRTRLSIKDILSHIIVIIVTMKAGIDIDLCPLTKPNSSYDLTCNKLKQLGHLFLCKPTDNSPEPRHNSSEGFIRSIDHSMNLEIIITHSSHSTH